VNGVPARDIIVVGASAGGVEALTRLVGGFSRDLQAAVFVVLHLPAHATSALPVILERSGPLPAAHPRYGEQIRTGRIYVAPPNQHILLRPGYIRLTRGPKENGHRPAIDPLFRTAAHGYGPRVMGVVLSGMLDDGTAGLLSIKTRGGMALVQRPEDALFPGMPLSALDEVEADHCLPASELGSVLERLAREPMEDGAAPIPRDMESEMADMELESLQNPEGARTPSNFGCPGCGGVLSELRDGELVRFRCRVGHAYSPETLLSEQSEALEGALWAALRALEENASLAGQLTARAQERGHSRAAARFREREKDAKEHAVLIRQVLLGKGEVAQPEAADAVSSGKQRIEK
jgi:two-component system chemotaxis response regulator CheB